MAATLRLLQADCITPNLRLAVPTAEAHAHHEIIALLRGSYRVEIGAGTLDLAPGELLVIPAGTVHRAVLPRDGSTAYHLVQWAGRCPVTDACRLIDGDHRLASAIDWLSQRSADGPQELLRALLAAILAEVGLRAAGDLAGGDPIDRVRAFIDQHLHYASLDLAQLAERAGLSRSRFSALFTARCGVSAMRYLRQRRLAAARRLLTDRRATLATVGAQVGIPDPAYLARLLGPTRSRPRKPPNRE